MNNNNNIEFNRNREKKFIQFAYSENKFNLIPPIVGILLSDLFGNAITTLEYNKNSKYKPIKAYLTDHKNKDILEIDLISMYLSSFCIFASNTNIQDLNHLEIHGSNLKIQIFFLFNKFMVIIFLNSNTIISLKLQEEILNYFSNLIKNNDKALSNFNDENSKSVIKNLKDNGIIWLKRLNKYYIQNFKKEYIMKYNFGESFLERIEPLIKDELNEYIQNIPEDILNDISREINNKIQDKVYELIFDLIKK